MASASKMELTVDDEEALEEEFEHFDDFTLASTWEKFISEIEAVCRQWLSDGPKNLLKKNAVQLENTKDLFKVKSDLKDVTKSYCIEYYFESNDNDKIMDWNCAAHDLQLCFGVKEFLVIAPQSASGVVLDTPESSKLLSAVAIALSNCSCLLPAFVPVHDPSRKAYIGIQNMGTVFTRRFEADQLGSQVPVKLMHLEGLYELFVSKFAYSALDFTVHLFKVRFTMKLTYKTLPVDEYDDDVQGNDTDINQTGGSPHSDTRNRIQWDDDCPWSEWYSAEDPVQGFELITTWPEKTIENSLEMAEVENYSPLDAEKWMLYPKFSPTLSDGSLGSRVGFASQLRLLVDALDMSFAAKFMEDFVSVENPTTDKLKSIVLPPPTVTDRVLKELFHEGVKLPNIIDVNKTSRAIKGAPPHSLFSQFCLHCLWFGNCNIRAIAVLWIEFVREVRWCWEELQPLPRMHVDGSVDLTTCLINQKLQMVVVGNLGDTYVHQETVEVDKLAICIERKHENSEDFQDCIASRDGLSSQEGSIDDEESVDMEIVDEHLDRKPYSPSTPDGHHESETSFVAKPEDVLSSDLKPECLRRGSAGVAGSLKLLKSDQSMHIPFTQEPPLMTEDMHEERLQAVEAFGNSLNFSAQLEKEILSSDMSAFKAANPETVFEDFIRWHSPGDWENNLKGSESSKSFSQDDWPPRGRLSQRMSEQGNMWRKIWNEAPALPASEQNPLLDPNKEGEKILHYLETVRPHQLLEQMVSTAFGVSAAILNQTSYGGLKPVGTRIDQLYLTLVSGLKSLQANCVSPGSESIEDLRRLCGVFEHVEKLLTVAASLHRKFVKAPRLSEAIFSDFHSFYLPRMGTPSSTEKDIVQKEFDKWQEVGSREREVISSMFVPPTANQSWRKVLSMGNLLNGHEPILREIIFSMRDRMIGNHYATPSPELHRQEIETYRMYLSGTSNDLRVALSVTSCD